MRRRTFCTVQGRVIYDREKHYFNVSDVTRILKSLDIVDVMIDFETFTRYLDMFFLAWRMYTSALFHLSPQLNKKEITWALFKLSGLFLEVLKFYFSQFSGVVLSIVMMIFSEFIVPKKEEEDGEG